jgi:GAF domain-containing protein
MPASLISVKTQLETQLSELSSLVWSSSALEEAIRAALAEIAGTYGAAVTLSGLDGAISTTLEDADVQVLVIGSVAHAARFRIFGRFEEVTPEDLDHDAMIHWAEAAMAEFQSALTQIRLRLFQESIDPPYSTWEWDEGRAFL